MARCSGYAAPFFLLWMVSAIATGFPGVAQADTRIAAEEIRNAVSEYVEKNHPWPAGSLRCTVLGRLSDAVFPQDSVTFEVVRDPREDFIGDTQVSIRYHSGRNLMKEETVKVSMEVLTDVVVSTRELVKSREIREDDVCVQKRWLKRIPTNVVTGVADVVGKTLAFNIKPNGEILKNAVRSHLLIKRGNVVRIVFDNDLFSIATTGISEEDGARDKVIRVKNLASNKTIYGRVTGDALVRVEF